MNKNENILLDVELRSVLDCNAFCALLSNGHEMIAFRYEDDADIAELRVGDFVKLDVSPFDMSKGRIIRKLETE